METSVSRAVRWGLALVITLSWGLLVSGAARADAQPTADLTRLAEPTGHITGTAIGNGPIADHDAEVAVWQEPAPTATPDQWVRAGTGWARADGTYDVGGLPAGRYLVQFTHRGRWEFWDNVYDNTEAKIVVVAEGQIVTGVDADLGEPLPKLTMSMKPEVAGKPLVGRTLRVSAGMWNSDELYRIDYRWFAADRPLAGGRERELTLRPQWRGEQLRVRLTVYATGFAPTTFWVRVPGPIR